MAGPVPELLGTILSSYCECWDDEPVPGLKVALYGEGACRRDWGRILFAESLVSRIARQQARAMRCSSYSSTVE
jgi:hypothetical protein